MSLLIKEVETGLRGSNIKYYEDLGYEIPKYKDKNGILRIHNGTKILVKVKDLPNGSNVFVDIECDGCGKELKNIIWQDYLRCVKEDGKYYCLQCALSLYANKNTVQTKLKNGKSFKQWCIDNDQQDVLNRWDYELNKLKPDEVSYGTSRKKYYFKCPRGLHESELKNIGSFTNGHKGSINCNQCNSFKQYCIENNYQDVLNRWDYELNYCRPEEISYATNKKYYFKCPKRLHKSELKQISSFTSGQEGAMKCKQCNTISVTHPYLIKYFINKEDTTIYSAWSAKKILMKCQDCGYEKEIKIYNLTNKGFSCPKCGDGISYPEKFIFNMLEQLLDKNFTHQLTKKDFKWCKNYRYDFYISFLNCIIETHGMQHYKETTGYWRKSLKEIQNNDKKKEQLAKENDIDNYIILDCRESVLEYIKDSVMNSELPKLLNFKESDIDWNKCHEYACNSLVKTVCDLWNSGIKNTMKISNEINLNKRTIIKYLKQGTKLKWCDYNPRKIKQQNVTNS